MITFTNRLLDIVFGCVTGRFSFRNNRLSPLNGEKAKCGNAASFEEWFPDLKIPDGLTFDDLASAAALIRSWAADAEWSAIPLAAELAVHFQAAARASQKENHLSARGAL